MEQKHTAHKYMEVYNTLRNDIILNRYSEGSLLPTETSLMSTFGVSRNTVGHALQMLKDEGMVSSLQGSGATVLSKVNSPRYVESKRTTDRQYGRDFSIHYFVEVEQITTSSAATSTIQAPRTVADAFGLEEGARVCLMQRIWQLNGRPYIYMKQYINPRVFPAYPESKDDAPAEIYRLLGEHQLHFIDGMELIRCKNADFVEANLLGLEPGTAVIFTTRTAICEEGTFEYTEFIQNPAFAGYSVRIGHGMEDNYPFRQGMPPQKEH